MKKNHKAKLWLKIISSAVITEPSQALESSLLVTGDLLCQYLLHFDLLLCIVWLQSLFSEHFTREHEQKAEKAAGG